MQQAAKMSHKGNDLSLDWISEEFTIGTRAEITRADQGNSKRLRTDHSLRRPSRRNIAKNNVKWLTPW